MPRTSTFVHRNLPLLLLQAREALMQHYRPRLRVHGLSDQQWRVLRVLQENDEGMETGRLAEQAYILGPSLTGILARMQKSGLVRRTRSADDARCMLVHATPAGRSLVSELSLSIEAQYRDLAGHLGRERLSQLYALLDDLLTLPPHTMAGAAVAQEEEG